MPHEVPQPVKLETEFRTGGRSKRDFQGDGAAPMGSSCYIWGFKAENIGIWVWAPNVFQHWVAFIDSSCTPQNNGFILGTFLESVALHLSCSLSCRDVVWELYMNRVQKLTELCLFCTAPAPPTWPRSRRWSGCWGRLRPRNIDSWSTGWATFSISEPQTCL